MRGKIVLVTFLVGWGLLGMLLGGLALFEGDQEALYQTTMLSFNGACHAGHLDACDQEVAAKNKSEQLSAYAIGYWLSLVGWATITLVVGTPVAGAFWLQRRRSQRLAQSWPDT